MLLLSTSTPASPLRASLLLCAIVPVLACFPASPPPLQLQRRRLQPHRAPSGVHAAPHCIRSLIDPPPPRNGLAGSRQAHYWTRSDSCLISHARPRRSSSAHSPSASYPAPVSETVHFMTLSVTESCFDVRRLLESPSRLPSSRAALAQWTGVAFCPDIEFLLFQQPACYRSAPHIPPA